MNSYNGFTGEQREQGNKIIKKAIKDGILKPLTEVECLYCKQKEGIRHYHNEDYTPENIISDAIPVCWRCHMMIHKRFRHPKSYEKYFAEIKKGKQYPPVYRATAWNELNIHLID
jgi:hypothetical protein